MLQNIETYFTTVVILVHLAQLCLHLRSKTKDQSFNNFEKISYKKLSVNQAKHFDLFVCQELCFYSTGVDFKIFRRPEKFPGLSRHRPQTRKFLKISYSHMYIVGFLHVMYVHKITLTISMMVIDYLTSNSKIATEIPGNLLDLRPQYNILVQNIVNV